MRPPPRGRAPQLSLHPTLPRTHRRRRFWPCRDARERRLRPPPGPLKPWTRVLGAKSSDQTSCRLLGAFALCGLLLPVGGRVRTVKTELLIDLGKDAPAHLVVILEELLGVLTALPQPLVPVGKPGARLLHHVVVQPHVQYAPLPGDTLAVHDVKLNHLERRRHLVLDYLDLSLVANRVVADLQRPYASYVEPDARIELQSTTTRRRLRRSEHNPDLLPELVDEDRRRPRTGERARKLPQSLTHKSSLKPHVRVSHLTFNLSSRYEGGDGVDDDEV